MTGRLVLAIIGTILEEIAIVAIVFWALPQIGVQIPWWGLVILMVAWAAYSIFTYRLGSRALMMDHVVGLGHMIGTRGEVVSTLNPEGLIRIKGELWVAKSTDGKIIKTGEEVTVVGQQRLKLVVNGSGDSQSSAEDCPRL